MTETFLGEPLRLADPSIKSSSYTDLESDIRILVDVTTDYYNKMDLELIMSRIMELQDKQFRKLFESKCNNITKIDENHLRLLKL